MTTMNRQTIEEALCKAVPHCSREWIDTGGGVHNLLVHTMRGDDPAGHDYGPVVGIGPFTPNGDAEFSHALCVWDEDAYTASEGFEDEPELLEGTGTIISAVLALIPA